MLNYSLLVAEKNSIDEFLAQAIEYNIQKAKSTSFDNDFFESMIGLCRFGSMINNLQNIKIFSLEIGKNNIQQKKYFAIDYTGLSHGFIYGPIHTPKGFISEIGNYYGVFAEKNCYIYDCIINFNPVKKKDYQFVDLHLLRNKFLPLLKDGNNLIPQRYFKTENSNDSIIYGPTIYQTASRSFHLPFKELISNYLNLDITDLSISPEYKKNSIHFTTTYSWQTRKYTNWKSWKGDISYDTFSILNIELIDEGSEYNW